jgi:CubicO group peptidase (beta-lactamase class C family)
MCSSKTVIQPTLAVTFLIFLLTLPLRAQSGPAAASAQNPVSDNGRIQRIEANVVEVSMGEKEPPLRLGLQKLMEVYKVPGLSVAVIDNFHIVWAKGYGVVEAGSDKPVTPKTLYQAGSISKPVAAAGALALVEKGKLALDEDVNQKLKTWKVPENEFTKVQKVTLRRLMSHSAGLTVHGFPGYDVDAPLPTLVQIFNGEKPANTEPIRVDLVPGTKARYSGGGVTIEQQLMIDVTGKPFPVLERELVLDKIGMADSSYEQPLPKARRHDRWRDLPRWQGGTWTLAHLSRDGGGGSLDDAHGPCEVRNRDCAVSSRKVEPCALGEDDDRDVDARAGQLRARLRPG